MQSEKLTSVHSSTTAHQEEQAVSKSSPQATTVKINATEVAVNALTRLLNEARIAPP
jgi:hypothetical protein